MGSSCCDHSHLDAGHDHQQLSGAQRRALFSFLGINLIMLGVELWGAQTSQSSGLLADSLHVLSHVLVALISLFALSRPLLFQLRAVFAKGLLMIALGVGSLFEVLWRQAETSLPHAGIMGWTTVSIFAFNLACLALLWPRRSDDLNMRSAWLCGFNDLLTNIGVLAASVLVSLTGSRVPDTIVGTAFSILIIWTSAQLTLGTFQEMRAHANLDLQISPPEA